MEKKIYIQTFEFYKNNNFEKFFKILDFCTFFKK